MRSLPPAAGDSNSESEPLLACRAESKPEPARQVDDRAPSAHVKSRAPSSSIPSTRLGIWSRRQTRGSSTAPCSRRSQPRSDREPEVGLEPTHSALQVRRSTTELLRRPPDGSPVYCKTCLESWCARILRLTRWSALSIVFVSQP